MKQFQFDKLLKWKLLYEKTGLDLWISSHCKRKEKIFMDEPC